MPMPSVIRLIEYIHIPFERKSLSRKNILLRDHNTCQYCGRIFPPQDLTLDHIAPRSRGGDSAWENLVTCCRSCNNRKGDRSPEAAGMRLLKRPQAYNLHVNRQIISHSTMIGTPNPAVANGTRLVLRMCASTSSGWLGGSAGKFLLPRMYGKPTMRRNSL